VAQRLAHQLAAKDRRPGRGEGSGRRRALEQVFADLFDLQDVVK